MKNWSDTKVRVVVYGITIIFLAVMFALFIAGH